MPILQTWWARLAALFRRDRLERDLDEEMAFHLDMLAADRARKGLPEAQARAGAQRDFGNSAAVKEAMRDGWSVAGLDQWARDLRHAVRGLRRAPGFTVVAVAALALGIGATTAILSVVHVVLLRPLPYTQPERLATIWEDLSRLGFARNTPAPGNYVSWKTLSHSFVDIAATRGAQANLTSGGPPEQVLGRRVTANFFSVLGVAPQLGRTFTADEDTHNAPVTIISYRLWQRRYAADPDIVGTDLLMNGERRTVIGVMPAAFIFRSREIDFWNPIAFTPADAETRNSHVLNVVGRLAPGVTLEQANAELQVIAARLVREYPDSNADTGAVAEPLRSDLLGSVDLQLMVLLAGAGCVLLIACANVASLLLSRALSRRRELAIRVSLGATTRGIVRQLVIEAMVLAVVGGVIGAVLAPAGVALITGLVPVSLPEVVRPTVDLRLLGVALVIAVLTGLIFSMLPAVHAARASAREAMQQGGRAGGGAPSRSSRDALVVIQVAAAVTLLVAAGLLLRTFDNLRRLELGFTTDQLVTMRTPLPNPKYSDGTTRLAFYRRVVDDLRQVPGIVDAAFVSMPPFGSIGNTISYRIDGREDGPMTDAVYRASTNRYLALLNATLISGRLLDERDGRDAPLVVVINETFATREWPGASPLGARIRFGSRTAPWRTVVGVIRDVRERGYEPAAKSAAYVPYAQLLDGWYPDNLIVRAEGDALAIVPAVRRTISGVDPEQPVAAVRPLQELVDLDVIDRREQTVLLTVFACLALALAALGLYGVLAHAVSQRHREIAVRVALGATRLRVIGSVTARGQWLVAAGLGIGLALAWAASRAVQTLLVGVEPTDPLTFATTAAVLWVVSVMASGVPAFRAVRVDPASALRDD